MAEALAPLAARLRQLFPLSRGDIEQLVDLPHTRECLGNSKTLVTQGSSLGFCCMLSSGIAARDRTTRAGTRQLLGFYLRGDLIGISEALLGVAHDNIQLFGPAEIVRISREAVLTLADSRPAIARALWMQTLIDASIAREWTLNVGRRDARQRLLHLLCELAFRQYQAGIYAENEITIPLSQEQLADALGLTPVHINRVLQSLRGGSEIDRQGRTIKIKDWDALARQADFDDSYMRVGGVALPDLAFSFR